MSYWKKVKNGWLLDFRDLPPEYWIIDAPTDVVPNSVLYNDYKPAVIPVIKPDFGSSDKKEGP